MEDFVSELQVKIIDKLDAVRKELVLEKEEETREELGIIRMTPNQLRTLIEIYVGHKITLYLTLQDEETIRFLHLRRLIVNDFEGGFEVTDKGRKYIQSIT